MGPLHSRQKYCLLLHSDWLHIVHSKTHKLTKFGNLRALRAIQPHVSYIGLDMFDFGVASLPSYRSALSGGQTEQAESMPSPLRPCFIVFVQMHGKKFRRSLDFKGTPNEVSILIDGRHSLPVPTS